MLDISDQRFCHNLCENKAREKSENAGRSQKSPLGKKTDIKDRQSRRSKILTRTEKKNRCEFPEASQETAEIIAMDKRVVGKRRYRVERKQWTSPRCRRTWIQGGAEAVREPLFQEDIDEGWRAEEPTFLEDVVTGWSTNCGRTHVSGRRRYREEQKHWTEPCFKRKSIQGEYKPLFQEDTHTGWSRSSERTTVSGRHPYRVEQKQSRGCTGSSSFGTQ